MKAVNFLVVVLAVDIMLFMGQLAVTEINPDGPEFYGFNGTLASDRDVGTDGNPLLDEDVVGQLPGGSGSGVDPETGNWFTDIFTSIKTWISDTTGASYILGVVNAVPNFLKAIGLPSTFTFLVGAFWHTITVFMLIMLLWGRDQ